MIKRLLLILTLAAMPLLAFGQAPDRDVLLTSDGTLYTAESVFATDATVGSSTRIVTLTMQQGGESKTVSVPGSLSGGLHTSPALAYDSVSDTLFIFWEQAINNRQNTKLLLSSYRGGKFGETAELDAADWRLRHNLRIGVTRKAEDRDGKGNVVAASQLNVHAVWWEESGSAEWARTAMITIENGRVAAIHVNDMRDFVDERYLPRYSVDGSFDPEALRHPQVIESAGHDTIDIVFGSMMTNGLERLTLKPVLDSRVRITIGIRHLPPPSFRGNTIISAPVISQVTAIASDHDHERLAFYFTTENRISYTMLKDGKWTPVRALAVDEHVSADAAVNAIRKLVTSE
jgi:hypothetical protein